MKRTPKPVTARSLVSIRRQLKLFEAMRITVRADVTKLQIQMYDLTSRIDALERKASK